MKKRRGTVSASTLADEDGRDLFVSHIDKCSHQPSDLISYVDGERLFRCLDDSEQHYIDLALKEFPPRNAAICRALYSPTTIDNIAAEFGVDERTVRRIGERAEIALRNLANTYQERNKSSDADAVIDLVQKLERVKAIRKSMNSARAYAQR
jgi:hypothetical protein